MSQAVSELLTPNQIQVKTLSQTNKDHFGTQAWWHLWGTFRRILLSSMPGCAVTESMLGRRTLNTVRLMASKMLLRFC